MLDRAAEESFAALLRRYRRAAGLTQAQVAERADLSERAVSDLERDDGRVPRRDTLDLLARALALRTPERAALDQAIRRTRSQSLRTTPAERVPPDGSSPGRRLPVQPTAFIGREAEIAAVSARLLDPATRLLTLLGPGGVGKTRLALQVAEAAGQRFPDGVTFVGLAALVDPALVLPTTAQALGVREVAGQTLGDTLATALGYKRLLLVLDNFEQVGAAAEAVQELLAAVPGLSVLATSRAALHIRGERVHEVVPLSVPRPPLPPPAALSRYEAVRLFIARAGDVQPDFTLTDETAPAVAEICARLDGLPLAIELAAARSRLLSPEALLARLGERLRVATGGARDLPDRQRTLRAAIDWSYGLLEPVERTLFARLAVFAGGRSLEAVETVCDPAGELGIEVLDGVQSLLDKSLLRREDGPGREPRLVLLETMQEYAREKLGASGEQGTLRDRHLAWCLALAEEAEPELRGPRQTEWLDRLEAEHDNLRAALSWARQCGAAEAGLRLAGALTVFWFIRGYYGEGQGFLEGALAGGLGGSAATRAKALDAAAHLAYCRDDLGRAAAQSAESLALYRELGDRRGIASALRRAGVIAMGRGDYGRAEALFEESLALCRGLGDKLGIANGLSSLANIAEWPGEPERSAALFEQSLALYRELGDKWGIAYCLAGLGAVRYLQGEYGRAAALFEEGLALCRELGFTEGVAGGLGCLGMLAYHQGDLGKATALLTESISLSREIGDWLPMTAALEALSWVVLARGEPRRATLIGGFVEALCEERSVPVVPLQRADHEGAVQAMREALGEEAFASARAEGRALLLAEAIALALGG